jgi:hypothetical protein
VSVGNYLLTRVVGNESVHDDLLPLSVLEKLKDSETKINAVIDDQVLEQLRLVGKEHE